MQKKVTAIIATLVYLPICGAMGDTVTNALADTPEGNMMEIQRLIEQAPVMMLSQTNNVHTFIDETCEKIANVPDTKIRYRYFRAFMDRACSTRFETIEDTVPFEASGSKSAVCFYDRQQEIGRLRAFAYRRLERVSDQIFNFLLVSRSVPAPCTELFEPYFKFIEKMESEEQRVGRKRYSLCERAIEQVEYHFNFIYFKVMDAVKAVPDPQDVAVFEERFKQVVGRPIRSAEQYEADSRRRMEENIKEHQKQQEANRRALEFQKKYNREHNINEH